MGKGLRSSVHGSETGQQAKPVRRGQNGVPETWCGRRTAGILRSASQLSPFQCELSPPVLPCFSHPSHYHRFDLALAALV